MELTRAAILRTVQFPRIPWKWLPMILLAGVLIAILAYPLLLLFIKSFAVSRPGQPLVWGGINKFLMFVVALSEPPLDVYS
jgi:hypothetical protein